MNASLLYSQLGYYAHGEKQAFIRAPLEEKEADLAGRPFSLEDQNGKTVYEGNLQKWGDIWRSAWWVADFTDFSTSGECTLITPAGASSPFMIGEDVLSSQGLRTIALDQLEARRIVGVPGWRDCGSEIRELSSMVITVLALCDLFENGQLLPADRKKIFKELRHGTEAIIASQESWSKNPEKDGRFNHDAFRMTHYGTTDYHNWHDTAYAITALLRALPHLEKSEPAIAKACLRCAERAFQNAVHRPYHLQSDFAGRDHPEIDYSKDDFAPFVHDIAGKLYGKEDGWQIPTSLRTKEKLVFADACCLLYERTGQAEYLKSAVAYADSACARQCRERDDIANGGIGYFYEFEGDDEAFTVEFAHNHKFLMGNIEPVNLSGLIKLLRLLPNAPQASEWLHTLHLYAQRYVKHTAALTPLSIYPQSVYPHPTYGGVHFFGMVVHGFTCLYGMIARNLFELSDFWQDKELARLGERNLLFAAGRNPGFPNTFDATSWECKSLIKGVGANTFGGHHDLSHVPDGSIVNGFAMTQFDTELRLGDLPDEPQGILKPDNTYFFNEDYLPHSHGYVRGAVRRETPAQISIKATNGIVPVQSQGVIRFDSGDECAFTAALDGTFTMPVAPMQSGSITLKWEGSVYTKPFFAAPGGHIHINVDFACLIEITAASKENVTLFVTIKNHGTDTVDTHLRLQASGIKLSEGKIPIRLAKNESCTVPLALSGKGTYLICRLPLFKGDSTAVIAYGEPK